MKTIKVTKRGYDFAHGEDWINVPYISTKHELVGYIKAIFGVDAFKNFRFALVRRNRY